MKKYLLLGLLYSRLEHESLLDCVLDATKYLWEYDLDEGERNLLDTRLNTPETRMNAIISVLNDLPQDKQELFRNGDIAEALKVIESM